MFTGLQTELQESVIDGILEKRLSIAEAKEEVKGKYVLQRTTEHLTEQLKADNWQEVQKEFGDRVSLSVLQQICSKYSAKRMISGMTRKERQDYKLAETVSVVDMLHVYVSKTTDVLCLCLGRGEAQLQVRAASPWTKGPHQGVPELPADEGGWAVVAAEGRREGGRPRDWQRGPHLRVEGLVPPS